MNINEAFPSKYLKASDLNGGQAVVTIASIKYEEVGDDNKPCLYFVGKEKGIVLNKTNANNIADIYGPDTDDWMGKKVTLYPAMVDFQGRSVEAIRVKAQREGKAAKAAVTTKAPAKDAYFADDPGFSDDDIPF